MINVMDPIDIKEPFLRKLRELIDSDPSITEAGLSVKAGLNNSTIRLMFKNAEKRSPRIDTARKICAALGTTLEEFMSDAQTPEEKEIVRLILQLPEHLRQQLLGYGQGLAAAADQSQPIKAEDKK
jgi:transcriptional regulator with XRE-family HTH domain